MTFAWTPHRFSGGALALDVANSVILRFDDQRRTDRFAVDSQLAAFAAAASALSAERGSFGALAPIDNADRNGLVALREAIDGCFRHRVRTGRDDPERLAALLEQIAGVLRRHAGSLQPWPVELATAHSALKLVCMAEPERMKICPNCEWLFIDQSRNRSRAWCDMAVCGNRAKARLHYNKTRKAGAQ